MIFIPSHIDNLKVYKAGKPISELAREKGLTKIVKLASNENPLGPSPKAKQAILDNIDTIHRYGDPMSFELINAISLKYNKPFDSIFVGSGSDAILQYIILALSEEKDTLLSSLGSFIGWYVNVNKLGRKSINVPLTEDYKIDLEAMKKKISNDIKIIYLANPNNPTGTMFTKQEFEDFMSFVPKNIVVILDEAYTLYAEDYDDYPNGPDYNYDNLIVVHTMSKSYGLAGIRIGYSFGPPYLINAVKKARLPFEPNLLSYYAIMAAINDEEFLQETKKLNKISLNMFRKFFDEIGIEYPNSVANFLTLIFKDEDSAIDFNNYCLNNGLILRYLENFGILNGVRINSGTIEETEFAIDVIRKYFKR